MYIVATISKNSYAPEKVREIIVAGATVLRFNFSHGTPEEVAEKIFTARKVIAELGMQDKVRIMADLPGDKIRLGAWGQDLFVTAQQQVTFRPAHQSDDPFGWLPVAKDNICNLVHAGDTITCGDGEVALKVKMVASDYFTAVAINDGKIMHLKALNIGRGIDALDHITSKTIEHIKHLDNIKPELVAFSFVNSKEFIKRGKELLAEFAPETAKIAKIVAKVETAQGVEMIDEIAKAADIVLVARGDLGLTMPIEALGLSQKKIVLATKKVGKEVIVSTQILESLLQSYTPLRSDVLDLTNIVLDGADGIMLAKETGISANPGYSVATAKKIIEHVEQYR
jgi:pyruvate kinase